jgi:predicted proteasome-type protease
MTYCIGMRLDAGLVFLSDSRTNAGVDHVGTARKMTVFESPGDRVMVMLTAGNLSISQLVRNWHAQRADAGDRAQTHPRRAGPDTPSVAGGVPRRSATVTGRLAVSKQEYFAEGIASF